jgi:threonine synthase
MKLYSTTGNCSETTWKSAVLSGLAPDGGLYLPTQIPTLPSALMTKAASLSFPELCFELASLFLGDEVDSDTLRHICSESFSFPVPVVPTASNVSVIELFHGPTCAFKDFGARFMARLFRHFLGTSQQSPLTVLVATSGDTGSAVANAFFDISAEPPIRVVILFPKGKVSLVQEKQMTTLGHNVTALEVDGTFDDCQRLVKQALADHELTQRTTLTTANSINIARLLPQMFYYVWAALQSSTQGPPLFVVPSGNLGNLTAGILAARAGLPVSGFIAACNANDVFPQYISSGTLSPRASIETISNAMDVGNPSNVARVIDLVREQSLSLAATSITDAETLAAIKQVYETSGYITDPHTAVGFAAVERLRKGNSPHALVLATAHPAKFSGTVSAALGFEPTPPPQLVEALRKPSQKVGIGVSYDELKREIRR